LPLQDGMILGRFFGLEKKGKHVLLWERNPLFEFEMMMMPHEGALAGSIIDSVAWPPVYGQAFDTPWVIFHRKIRASGGDQEKS